MIIAFCGAINVGKSTAAKHLRDHYGFTLTPLADGVREELITMLVSVGFTREAAHALVYTTDRETKEKMLRPGFQWWGTDVRRAMDEDYWVKQLADKITIDGLTDVVIDDLRFPNEADWVKRSGGQVIRLERIGPTAFNVMADSAHARHSSEQQTIHPTSVIRSRSVETLYETLDRHMAMDGFKKKLNAAHH